ncbi:MAG: hypothetical protein Q8K75_07895 [Chlamydiales bacterium]|nr:hypothetical protein [Chlamydiales bacterium]
MAISFKGSSDSGSIDSYSNPEANPEQTVSGKAQSGHRYSILESESPVIPTVSEKIEPTPKAKRFKGIRNFGSSVVTRIHSAVDGVKSIFRSPPPPPLSGRERLGMVMMNLPMEVKWGEGAQADESPDKFLAQERDKAAITQKLGKEDLSEKDKGELQGQLDELRKYNPAQAVEGVDGLVSAIGFVDSKRIHYDWGGKSEPSRAGLNDTEQGQVFTKAIFDDLQTKFEGDDALKSLPGETKNELAHTTFASLSQAFEQPIFKELMDTSVAQSLIPQDIQSEDGLRGVRNTLRTYVEDGQVHLVSTRIFKMGELDSPGTIVGYVSYTRHVVIEPQHEGFSLTQLPLQWGKINAVRPGE